MLHRLQPFLVVEHQLAYPAVQEPQRERYRQLELPDALHHRGGFADGLRGKSGGCDGHTIALKKPEISRLARSGRS
jgi:hypothetical protein